MEMHSQKLKFSSNVSKPSRRGWAQHQIFGNALSLILIYSATNSNNMQKEALLKNKYYQLAYKSGTADTVSG